MISIGTWKARALEGALGEPSKEDGNPVVAVGFQILEGPDTGSHITWYGYLTEKTFERTIESLRYCGWQGDMLDNLHGITDNDVYLVVEHEPDQQGELRARVRWVNAGGGVALKNRMTTEAASSFAQRMRGQVIAAQQRSPRAAPAPAAANSGARDFAPSNNSDDIPF